MVRLDDFAVFVNGGGTDDGQVAVRQFGFQYISRTGISLSVVQQYMDFVNKQDCIVDIPQFFQDVFQAVLDFPLVGGSRNQGGVVQFKYTGFFQKRGDFMADYLPGKSVNQCCLSYSGITDNQDIGLAPASQYLHDHTVFTVAVDDRMQLVGRIFG